MWTGWLDFHTLSSAPEAAGAPRQLQAIALTLALLPIAVSRSSTFTTSASLPSVTIGSLIYLAGAIASEFTTAGLWIAAAGALVAASGILAEAREHSAARPLLGIVGAGLLVDAAMACLTALPGRPIGDPAGLPLRLSRLAQIAALALPMLAWDSITLDASKSWVHRWRRPIWRWGAFSMPVLLLSAAFLWPPLRYALFVPADLVYLGSILSLRIAILERSLLAISGWTLLAMSMTVGLALGTFAFAGPLSPPVHFLLYHDPERLHVRVAHTYAIVMALMLLLAGRHAPPLVSRLALFASLAMPLLVIAALFLPASLLFAGPLIGAAASVLLAITPCKSEDVATPGQE